MPKQLLIVKNVTYKGAGILESILKERSINYSIIELEKGEMVPPLDSISAVVMCGGSDNANDKSEKMLYELSVIKDILTRKIPYLGICLGLQVLIKAAGGSVRKNEIEEIGFRDTDGKNFTIELTQEGKKDPLCKGLPDSFKVFHLHEQTVDIMEDMTLLATGKFCKNQIVKVGPVAYGIQFHFEMTPEGLAEFDGDEFINDYNVIKDEYDRVGRQLFNNFLEISGI